jgi:hypothetical protein
MKRFVFLVVLSMLSVSSISQKIIRNYSFEYFDCLSQPIGWRSQITKPNAYLVKLRTDEVKGGDCSVSIVSNPDYTGEKVIGLLIPLFRKMF